MTRIILAIALLAGALIPGGQASSLRVRKMHARNAVHADSFRKNFGWPGHNFPCDKWGAVMDSEAVEEAAAEAATATIVRPNLGTAPVNVEPAPPAASTPVPPFSGFSIISTVSQAIPTSSQAVIGDISVSNATSSASSSPASKTTSQLLSPLVSTVSTHKPSSSPSPSSVQTPPIVVSVHSQPPSSIAPSFAPSPSHSPSSPPPQAAPPSSSPTPQPSSPPPAAPAPSPSPAPINVESGGGSSNQGNQGENSGSSSSSSSSGPTSPSDIQAYLTAHNTVRAQHGASPLTYSQSLAAKAQQWADGCIFQHSGGTLGPFGENLAAGTGSGYGISQAIGSWTAEVSQYNPNAPVASHFTQVVWKSTTQVGCALQDCSGIFAASFGLAHYYVCEYSPAGNVIGEFPANVQV